jgi:alkylhydroperoxidase family enzyme
MRLKPIEKPRSWIVRAAYAMSRRQFGKVITPLSVTYARLPHSLWLGRAVQKFLATPGPLDPGLKELVLALVATINNCTFCIDISRARVEKDSSLFAKLDHLLEHKTAPGFTEKEKSVLSYVEELIRNRAVSDKTFADMAAHCSENEIVEVTFACALESYYNVLNIGMGIESDGLCAIDRKGRRKSSAA